MYLLFPFEDHFYGIYWICYDDFTFFILLFEKGLFVSS